MPEVQITAEEAKKIANADSSAGGSNITDGNYMFLIKRMSIGPKFKGLIFIAEFQVEVAEKRHAIVDPNPEGSSCALKLNLTTNVSAARNLKQFLAGGLGIDEGKMKDTQELLKILNEWCGDSQKGRGMLVKAETYRKVTQSGVNIGKEGTYPSFGLVEDGLNTTEKIETRRKQLDAERK